MQSLSSVHRVYAQAESSGKGREGAAALRRTGALGASPELRPGVQAFRWADQLGLRRTYESGLNWSVPRAGKSASVSETAADSSPHSNDEPALSSISPAKAHARKNEPANCHLRRSYISPRPRALASRSSASSRSCTTAALPTSSPFTALTSPTRTSACAWSLWTRGAFFAYLPEVELTRDTQLA